MCCFTRNNLLPWSLSYRSRIFPSMFVHSFSLPVPLPGFFWREARDKAVCLSLQHAFSLAPEVPLKRRETHFADWDPFIRLSLLEQCLEKGRQPRLSTVISNTVVLHMHSIPLLRAKGVVLLRSAKPGVWLSQQCYLPHGRGSQIPEGEALTQLT